MINYKVIFNFLGFLLILNAIAMMFGIQFSIYYGDDDIFTLLFSGLAISTIGFITYYLTKDSNKDRMKRE